MHGAARRFFTPADIDDIATLVKSPNDRPSDEAVLVRLVRRPHPELRFAQVNPAHPNRLNRLDTLAGAQILDRARARLKWGASVRRSPSVVVRGPLVGRGRT
jgi:hypothetical protein